MRGICLPSLSTVKMNSTAAVGLFNIFGAQHTIAMSISHNGLSFMDINTCMHIFFHIWMHVTYWTRDDVSWKPPIQGLGKQQELRSGETQLCTQSRPLFLNFAGMILIHMNLTIGKADLRCKAVINTCEYEVQCQSFVLFPGLILHAWWDHLETQA